MAEWRVLLATDGSEAAQAAARWLRDFPLPADTQLLILSVASVRHASLAPDMPSVLADATRAHAREAGEEAKAVLRARWPAAEARMVEGQPADQIIQMAAEWGAEVTVLGSRGLGALARALLGSVSLAVARHLPTTVLVTRGEPRPIRSLVVGLDGSEDSLQASRFLATLPLDPGTRVTVLGAVEPVLVPPTAPDVVKGHLRAAAHDLEGERRRELVTVLERAAAELRGRVATVEVETPVGSPAETILDVAGRSAADLIVAGRRGLGAIRRLLLGSVSEKLLRDATCPVLIVRR